MGRARITRGNQSREEGLVAIRHIVLDEFAVYAIPITASLTLVRWGLGTAQRAQGTKAGLW